MARISFSQLEEARNDPGAFRARLAQGARPGFGATYFSSLRDAIFQYHTKSNILGSRAYLERRLSRFRRQDRIDHTLDDFDWYVNEHVRSNLVTFRTRVNVEYPLTPIDPSVLRISGQISRLDLSPTGGYAAWLFRSRDHTNWDQEIQLPLIQYTLSTSELACPLSDITMGIISFEERFKDTHSYTQSEVEKAISELLELLALMGYGLGSSAP